MLSHGSNRPSRMRYRTNSAVPFVPVALSISRRWCSTVLAVIFSRTPMSPLDRPSATSRATSSCRSVSCTGQSARESFAAGGAFRTLNGRRFTSFMLRQRLAGIAETSQHRISLFITFQTNRVPENHSVALRRRTRGRYIPSRPIYPMVT